MSVGRYWILTIPHYKFTPFLPKHVSYIKGQLEQGHGESAYLHWQLIAAFSSNQRLAAVRKIFGDVHAELTRSSAALDYVWKEDTAIAGTRFELGSLALKRNSKRDWQSIWEAAKSGDIEDIDYATRVQHYRTIKQITADYLQPEASEKEVVVFWGATGTGKSRRAWAEAGLDAYPKDPRTKFWCGYRGQKHIVIDEFRGGIDIAHLLRWLDRYPVTVETKGSATVLRATRIWITSNLPPRGWFPGLDEATISALLRRVKVTHFVDPFAVVGRVSPRLIQRTPPQQ